MNWRMKFSLGDRLKCTVTGFTGVCIGRNEWLNGCKQYCLKPPVDKDGKILAGEWIDENQLTKVKAKAVDVKSKPTGGPNKDAPKA